MLKILFQTALLLFLLSVPFSPLHSDPPGYSSAQLLFLHPQSTLLEALPDGLKLHSIQFSEYGGDYAYRMHGNGKEWWVINGKIKKPYDRVFGFVSWSQDGQQYSYCAREGDRSFVVTNGKEGESFEKVEDLRFSQDGKTLVYKATEGPRQFVVVNGQKSKPYGKVSFALLSPDGKRVAYAIQRAGKWLYILDSREGREYDEVGYGLFSRDSQTFAYEGRRGQEHFVVINHQESKPYDQVVFSKFFTPNFHAFVGSRRGKAQVIWKNQEGKAYLGKIREFVVSKDGNHLAYIVHRESVSLSSGFLHPSVHSFVVMDGQEQSPYPTTLSDLSLSADGKQFAHLVDGSPSGNGLNSLIMLNGKTISAFLPHLFPGFSPDGKKFSYFARKAQGEKMKYVVEIVPGTQGEPMDDLLFSLWSPEGNTLAYVAQREGKQWMVVNQRLTKSYDEIGPLLSFSRDGKSLGYFARSGRELWWVAEQIAP